MKRILTYLMILQKENILTQMKVGSALTQIKKNVFKKSAKDAYLITPTASKAMYTVIVSGNAAGDFLPLLVYKAIHLNENWTLNGPNGARYKASESGSW